MGAEGSRTLLPTCNVRSEASDTNIILNKNAVNNTDGHDNDREFSPLLI